MNSMTVMLKVMRAVPLTDRYDDPAFSGDTLNHPGLLRKGGKT